MQEIAKEYSDAFDNIATNIIDNINICTEQDDSQLYLDFGGNDDSCN